MEEQLLALTLIPSSNISTEQSQSSFWEDRWLFIYAAHYLQQK